MTTTPGFSLASLLFEEGGRITGAGSLLQFAAAAAQTTGLRFNRLARLYFDEQDTMQQYNKASRPLCDILLVGARYTNDLWVSL